MKKTILIQNLKDHPHISCDVSENESAIVFIYSLNPLSVDATVSVRLLGSDAEAMVYGIVIGAKDHRVTLHTTQHHAHPNTSSNLLVKSVLFDSSTFSYEGVIRVDKHAQKTDAYQKNENLIISDKAYAESKPSLEILADDVRCTHGATIGTIDKDQCFYLQTRGISSQQSIALIVEGFLADLLQNISGTIQAKRIQQTIWRNISKQLQYTMFQKEQ